MNTPEEKAKELLAKINAISPDNIYDSILEFGDGTNCELPKDYIDFNKTKLGFEFVGKTRIGIKDADGIYHFKELTGFINGDKIILGKPDGDIDFEEVN